MPTLIQLISTGLVSGGGALFVKELVSGYLKLRKGISGRETKRRIDIVQQRNTALDEEARARARADAAEARLDAEIARRRRMEEYAFELRRVCQAHGTPLSELPPWPNLT